MPAARSAPPDLVGGPAVGQGLEGLVVEDGVVDDRVVEVEDRRLADEQDLGVGGQLGVERARGGLSIAGTVVAERRQVAGPLVEAGQGGRAVDEVGRSATRGRIAQAGSDQARPRDQSAPRPARTARRGQHRQPEAVEAVGEQPPGQEE